MQRTPDDVRQKVDRSKNASPSNGAMAEASFPAPGVQAQREAIAEAMKLKMSVGQVCNIIVVPTRKCCPFKTWSLCLVCAFMSEMGSDAPLLIVPFQNIHYGIVSRSWPFVGMYTCTVLPRIAASGRSPYDVLFSSSHDISHCGPGSVASSLI